MTRHTRTSRQWRHWHLRRYGLAASLGLVAALASLPAPWLPVVHVLVGVTVALLVSSGWALHLILTLDGPELERHYDDVEPGRGVVEILGFLGAAVSLLGVGVLLLADGTGLAEAVIALLAVAAGWLTVHTTYTLVYAKHWITAEPGCIEFPRLGDTDDAGAGGAGQGATPATPDLSEFGYIAFSVGMTYQVSDTTVRSTAMRRLILQHGLTGFVFGTVIVAATINLVAGLAG
ncbi:MAG: DUF1345 domain-containing protein [Micrococcus sp.]|nr:DUF1345 domain-containing protein [Micrococcus sp.]